MFQIWGPRNLSKFGKWLIIFWKQCKIGIQLQGYSCNGRLKGSHMSPIGWHYYLWPCITWRSLLLFETLVTPIPRVILLKTCLDMNGKAHMAGNFNCLFETESFETEIEGHRQWVTCTVKVWIWQGVAPFGWNGGRSGSCNYILLYEVEVIYVLSNSCDCGDLERSFTYCKPSQMWFFVHLCSSWQLDKISTDISRSLCIS